MPFNHEALLALYAKLQDSPSEEHVSDVLTESVNKNGDWSWHLLGGNENNFGVVENRQSSPTAALIEKITNSIDATLMHHCLVAGIDPKLAKAPATIATTIEQFFSPTSEHGRLSRPRKAQAEATQKIASGSIKRASLLFCYDGVGQKSEVLRSKHFFNS
jgi:hypothetical protein